MVVMKYNTIIFTSKHICFHQTTKAVYDRIIDLRIATPQIIINFGMFLEEHKYFEEGFKVSACMIFVGTVHLFQISFYNVYEMCN